MYLNVLIDMVPSANLWQVNAHDVTFFYLAYLNSFKQIQCIKCIWLDKNKFRKKAYFKN